MYIAHIKSGWSKHHVYIGRETSYRKGSALANPFRLVHNTKEGRAQNAKQYRRWLFTRLQAGDAAVWQALRDLRPASVLVDYCPTEASHGYVIRNAWLYYVSQGLIKVNTYVEESVDVIVPVPAKVEARITDPAAPVVMPVSTAKPQTKTTRKARAAKTLRDLVRASGLLAQYQPPREVETFDAAEVAYITDAEVALV